jgi:excinuclease ABC subunit A
MEVNQHIFIKGAREHNLKNIDVTIPRNKLVVITGLSGSGKSSLAFDTLYAEGQRRYVESLSAYARQFLGLMEKPDVDYIEGLSPAISIEQKSASRNPRSTVATVTEIYDYFRLLYARIGIPHCPNCGKVIERQTVQQIVDQVLQFPLDSNILVLAPLVRGRKGTYQDLFRQIQKDGYLRVRVNGDVRSVEEEINLERYRKHNIEVVVDRLKIKPEIRERLTESVETSLKLASGLVLISTDHQDHMFSEQFACPDCGISLEELEPRMFSFNSPYGACPACAGIGSLMEIDPALIVRDSSKTIRNGAIASLGEHRDSWTFQMVKRVATHFSFNIDTPFKDLNEKQQKVLLYGSSRDEIKFRWEGSSGRSAFEYLGRWEGIIPNLQRRYRQTKSTAVREWIEGFMNDVPCRTCGGKRLKPESLAVTIRGLNIIQLSEMSIKQSLDFFSNLEPTKREETISYQIVKGVKERLGFMVNVGLDYLTMDRKAGTLSGGEAQRIRLATQIGSQLVGVLYILDEPSIGLHQRDNHRLINTLEQLRDIGNTVIVVEHDRDTIEHADYVVDLGPGAGIHGGEIVVSGPPATIKEDTRSLTGKYLSGRATIPVPGKRRKGSGQFVSLLGAKGNNLKSITVDFPLGKFVVITGVSGSGKSTLVNETLYRILSRKFYQSKDMPHPYSDIKGMEFLDKVIAIDQSPIGRTPRSNPATYTGLFTMIRDLFAQLPESKIRGYKPGRFSFNVKGGRCESCQGGGIIKIEMHFLPDVYVPCEVCHGMRYNRETLEIKYKGKSIADVLDMTVKEAVDFFRNIPALKRKLQTLQDVGLDYICLGQQATTLSGGEAQRVKLSAELSKIGTGRTLYILDEPTTGLHFADIQMLLNVLNRLVDKGNTVIVIEHNMDVIKTADWIIDLGPEGGDDGGYVVASGTPEQLVRSRKSYTGQFLKSILPQKPPSLRSKIKKAV